MYSFLVPSSSTMTLSAVFPNLLFLSPPPPTPSLLGPPPPPRSLPHLLAAFLCDSHTEHPLQDMLRPPWALQCFHVAGVRQQRAQPRHLHHLQYRVQEGLHQDPQLLRARAFQELKMEITLATCGPCPSRSADLTIWGCNSRGREEKAHAVMCNK